MRTFAGFCLTATLLTAPAFAQAPAGTVLSTQPPSGPAAGSSADAVARRDNSEQMKFSLGVVDRLTIQRQSERPGLIGAPIQKEQLGFAWRPAGKWGITLDLTSRSRTDLVVPKEELSAGAYYQVTPRFRFGGGVTLNADNLRSAANNWAEGRENGGEAGVRIESAFSF